MTLAGNLYTPPGDGALELEVDYQRWLKTIFYNYVSSDFSTRHDQFWRWVWDLKRGKRPNPFIAIWPRGGAKTTSAELATVVCGATDRRRFILYVRSTQDKADESVTNIANMLEKSTIDRYYPELGKRKVGKFGQAKGWRRESLRTSAGLIVDGIGLDTAARGIKVDEYRPDMIVLDDIDDRHDSPDASRKKKESITQSILPAGSSDVAVLGIQNLIIPHGVFSMLVKPNCDFLVDRFVSGPYRAVDNLEYAQAPTGGYVITGGQATWAGQSLEVCQNQINTWGLEAFEREAQHMVDDNNDGMFGKIKYRHCSAAEIPDLTTVACWVDPAVTSDGDCQGIQIDGIDGSVGDELATIYRLFSWEGNDSPTGVIKMALRKANEFKADHVGFETNQGGDLWRDTYYMIANQMIGAGEIERIPDFRQAKADSATGGKAHRAGPMLIDYENGRIVHVFGTHEVLEAALGRFPLSKPFDLVDASVWSRFALKNQISTMA